MRPTPGANLPAAVARFLRDAPHSNQSMAHLAEKLIENGYPIIPVQWGRKNPLLDEWVRDWEHPPTIEQVNGWLAHWPACGVGIPCGWVIAIDIDILDQTLAGKIRQLALEVLGSTSLVRIGQSPKLLLVYRSAEPFETMNEDPIQILGKGAQFVAYNLHEVTGRPYDWPVDNLVDIPLADLPLVTQEACRMFLARVWDILPASLRGAKQKADRVVRVIPDHGKRRGTMRALGEALNWIDNSGEGLHYDEWIKRLLGVSHSLGLEGLSIIEGWSAQSTKNRPEYTCSTYLSLRPDGRYKAGSIYRDAMSNGWSPDYDITLDADVEEAVAEVDLSGLFDEGGKFRQEAKPNGDGRHVSEPEPEPDPPTPGDQLPVLSPDLGLIQHPGGILEEVANWITDTMAERQPELAMAGAIALVGLLGGHRYRLRRGGHDTRTNINLVGLAPSATGKEHIRQCLKAALASVMMSDFFSDDIGSGQGLEGAFVGTFVHLVMMDEYGHKISSALGKGSSIHERKLVEVITKLSTSAVGEYKHTRLAINKKVKVASTWDPCLVLFATTVEDTLWEGLNASNMSDGSLARHLFIRVSNPDPEPRRDVPDLHGMLPEVREHALRIITGPEWGKRPVNAKGKVTSGEALQEGLQHLLLREKYDATGKIRFQPVPPILIDAGVTSDAEEELWRVHLRQTELKRGASSNAVRAVAGRLLEHTSTLALIAAISLNPAAPVIDVAQVRWGEAFVLRSMEILLQASRLHIAINEPHGESLRMLRMIIKLAAKEPTGWVIRRAVTRATQWFKGPDRDRIRQDQIKDLVAGEFLAIKPDLAEKGRKKPGTASYYVKPLST